MGAKGWGTDADLSLGHYRRKADKPSTGKPVGPKRNLCGGWAEGSGTC